MPGEIEPRSKNKAPKIMWAVWSMPVIAAVIVFVGSLMNGASLDVEAIKSSLYAFVIGVVLTGPFHAASVWRTRRFSRRIRAKVPSAAVIVGEAAEVTDDDLAGNLVDLESGWLERTAVVVLPDRLQVWGKDAEETGLVLDRSRLQVRTVKVWVKDFDRGYSCVGVWVTDGDCTVVIVPTDKNARRTDRALSRALADLGEDVTEAPRRTRQ